MFDPCFFYSVLSILFNFAVVSLREKERERAGCFTLIVFLISRGCKNLVSKPHNAFGWSAVSVIVTFSEIIIFCLCISRIWIIKLNICKINLTYHLFKMINNCLFVLFGAYLFLGVFLG